MIYVFGDMVQDTEFEQGTDPGATAKHVLEVPGGREIQERDMLRRTANTISTFHYCELLILFPPLCI